MLEVFLLVTVSVIAFILIIIRTSQNGGFSFMGRKKNFWGQFGIMEIDGSKIVSEMDILLGRRDITERDDHACELMGDTIKFLGMVETPRPILLIKDLDLIKLIFIKNSDNFVDRRQFFGAAREDSVLRKMLGNLQGEEWKGVRASVTPTFTTGKIRRMMQYINSVGEELVTVLRGRANESGSVVVDAYGIASNYTVDVIASAIFGLQAGTVKNPKSVFSTMANRLVYMSPFQTIKFTLSLRFPKLFQFFNIDFMDMEALYFFELLLNKSLQARMSDDGTEKRNDFLQLLVEAKKGELKAHSKVEGEEIPVTNFKEERKQFLTDKVMSGQCLSFFFAGFRTTSTFITFAMYSMALHQNVQEKLRKEVKSIFGKYGGVDYDEIGQLVYLDMVICEVLRKFPATLRLERLCVSEFHDSETGLHVPKGCMVGAPLHFIHNDKRFYKNPDAFDPEHFSQEAKAQRKQYCYMPFGIGTRSCIGMRFALVESKAALAYLVHHFLIEPTENTPKTLKGHRVNFQFSPPPNLELKLTPICKEA